MKVIIRKIPEKDKEQVIIECVEITSEIQEIRAYISHKGREVSGVIDGQNMVRICLEDVYYFEALDEKVFAYTKEQVCEIRMRLYEAEQLYKDCHFVRVSKSVILNLMLLESISPALNGRFFAHMKNGERLMISRQYAPRIKRIVMGGKDDE